MILIKIVLNHVLNLNYPQDNFVLISLLGIMFLSSVMVSERKLFSFFPYRCSYDACKDMLTLLSFWNNPPIGPFFQFCWVFVFLSYPISFLEETILWELHRKFVQSWWNSQWFFLFENSSLTEAQRNVLVFYSDCWTNSTTRPRFDSFGKASRLLKGGSYYVGVSVCEWVCIVQYK